MPVIAHFLSLALIALALQDAKPASQIIASSRDWRITAADFEHAVNTFPAETRELLTAQPERGLLVKELVRIWVLSAEARKKGIEVGTSYESRRDYYQKFAAEISSKITDEEIRKYYDSNPDDFMQVALSHILILNGDSPISPYAGVERLPYAEAKKKADEIKAMLDKGADWDKISKEYSQAMDVKDRGGSIGYIFRSQVAKSLANAAFALKVGEISDVVDTIYGLHILRITDKRLIPFEEVREVLRQKLTVDEVNRQLDVKIKEVGVTIDEDF